jgi:hypothetical protein
MKTARIPRFLALGILLVVLVAGCAGDKSSRSARPDATPLTLNRRIKPLEEKLYLDTKVLVGLKGLKGRPLYFYIQESPAHIQHLF